MRPEPAGVIIKVTVEKIYTGMAFRRRYYVQYSTGTLIVYDIPPDNVKKFIKQNYRDLTRVGFKFKDGSAD